jgi:diguanylate cyclase (GGDEF)-like protein
MIVPRRSRHDLADIAERVAASVDLPTAFDTLVAETSRALKTRACLFQALEEGWILVAQARGGLNVPLAQLNFALSQVSSSALATTDLGEIGEVVWTSVPLKYPHGSIMVLLLAGDWTWQAGSLVPLGGVLPFVFKSVEERAGRERAERLLVAGHSMVRRLTQLGDLEVVCKRIVEQVARTIEAGRVAIALYRPEENCLVIPATQGYPASLVKDVRVEPGSGVIGHVFASGRPVLVPDVHKLPEMMGERRQYRTSSFAAVPLLAGRQVIGVVCATDKADGSIFDKRDAVALRTLCASAALALVAARSDSESHRLAYAATIDALTGLFNRTYLDVRLLQEVERARRGNSSLTLLLADIDDFKRVNDTYGHQTGDAVLRLVGGILRSAVRVFDVCARYGGDEFAIVMPSSDHQSAGACAERIRQRVAEHHMEANNLSGLPPLTMSIGVSVLKMGESPADFLGRADRYLYQAKARGKNCVCGHAELPVDSSVRLETSGHDST